MAALQQAVTGEGSNSLRPYELQVGGHQHAGKAPASLVDGQGRFLKRLQVGERGDREAAFYSCMEQHRQQPGQQQQQQQVDQQQQQQQEQSTGCASCRDQHQHSLMQQLAQWVPLSYGTQDVSGERYLVMEDLTAGYKQPCILDIKMGYQTWYAWASEASKHKYRLKDESTTQASLGFRLCGMVVQQAADSSSGGGGGGDAPQVTRHDRHWGKQLDAQGVAQALRAYADNGHLSLPDICSGQQGLLQQLQSLTTIFEQQQSWHFFSASLLVVYEGSAQTAAEARVRLRLIDFAHSFRVAASSQQHQHQQQQEQYGEAAAAAAVGEGQEGPTGRDQNFLDGLNSLISVLQAAMQPDQ